MSTENIKQGLKIQGGEAVARMLRAFHCGPMFGMGGFQLLPMYEAARKMNLQHFLINDERVAAFAADAYAKVSGRVGLKKCGKTIFYVQFAKNLFVLK